MKEQSFYHCANCKEFFEYIGTYQIDNGALVFHLFEEHKK
jgi:hypothetical protein